MPSFRRNIDLGGFQRAEIDAAHLAFALGQRQFAVQRFEQAACPIRFGQ